MLDHWLSDVFSHPSPEGLFIIAGKTAIIYLFLVLGLRLLGKRELGQMTIYDVVLLIVLANSVQNAMVGDDTTLAGGLVAGLTLLIMNRLFALLLTRSRHLEQFMVGEPLVIVSNGKMLKDRMAREGITHDQLMAALREHGICSVSDVQMCVLEVDGSISVVPNNSQVLRVRKHYRALRLG